MHSSGDPVQPKINICIKKYVFIYGWAGSALLHGLPPVVPSGGYALVLERWLPIAVTCPVEHPLEACELTSCGPWTLQRMINTLGAWA